MTENPSMLNQDLSPAIHGNASFHIDLSLDLCLKCNICTTACPVMAVTDLFPGPKYVGPQAARFRTLDQPSPDHSVDYCSGCRVCNMVCPAGVKIAELNARARAVMVKQGKFNIIRRLRNNVLARAALLGAVAQPIAPLANAVMRFKLVRWIAEKTLGIAREAPFPSFSSEKFTTWFRKHPLTPAPTPPNARNKNVLFFLSLNNEKEETRARFWRKVVFFHGCSTQYYEPRVGKAAVKVLEANGFEVIVPRQNCCGLPLLSNGEFHAARKYHQNNVRSLVGYARQGIPIVGTSTSCTLTLKEEAPELLDMHDDETSLVAKNTFDFNEFLLMLYDGGTLNLDFHPIPLELPYHVPCQYRAHHLGKPGLEVLSLIPGLRIVDGCHTCCGIAGTYGYKAEKYKISMAVGEPLFDWIKSFGAPLAVCDSETCRWQITHATGLPVIHPVELLAAAYGYETHGVLQKSLGV
jgi:glycerol-3-phosphate dehydrogenase subunit C